VNRLSKGLTIIEVMVVIVIIGILASLAVPKFREAHRKALMQEQGTAYTLDTKGEVATSKRMRLVGLYDIGGAVGPTLYVVFDSTSGNEIAIVRHGGSVAVAVIPKEVPAQAEASPAVPTGLGNSFPSWKVP